MFDKLLIYQTHLLLPNIQYFTPPCVQLVRNATTSAHDLKNAHYEVSMSCELERFFYLAWFTYASDNPDMDTVWNILVRLSCMQVLYFAGDHPYGLKLTNNALIMVVAIKVNEALMLSLIISTLINQLIKNKKKKKKYIYSFI